MSDTDNRPDNGDHDHVDFSDSKIRGPVQGTGTQNNYFGISRVPATLPHQVGVIPSRAGCFQDRAEAGRLVEALAGGGTTIVGSAGDVLAGGVLAGMGGVGKTQLAANYARTAWQAGDVDVLVWITANNATAAASGYAQAGMEVLGADPTDPQRAAQAFLAWLEPKPQERPCRWLVVLDDVTDPADLNGLWPPASPHGRTLVTTRRKDAALTGDRRQLIQVGLFTRGESIAYLAAALAAHHRHEPGTDLTALADDLGDLPLALAQAAAYLIDSGETVDAYRHLLANRATKLADAAPDVLPDDQVLPLAAAWSLSIDRADTLRPAGLARPMLQIAALLDANGIPQNVLTSSPALAHLTSHRTGTGTGTGTGPEHSGEPSPVSQQDAVRALRALHRLSLIDHTPETPREAVRVHQLIQRATRDTLTAHQRDETARSAADALVAAWPAIARDTALAQTLRANATALAGHAGEALYRPDAHAVLYRTGNSLGETGQVTAACNHYQHLTETTRHHLGEDHPDTLTTRNNLAAWRGEAGDLAGAAQAYADLLKHTVRVLGEDHPDTLTARGNLATWRGEAGDAAGAAQAYADLLKHTVRVLGEDHPHTLTARNNLATWWAEAGDLAGAAQAYADLLKHTVRVLGEDHPDTLTTRNNLAAVQGRAGDAAGAAQAYADLLADRIRVLGEDHPDTLTTRSNLAAWRGEAGDLAGAAQAYADLLADRIRVLGEDHPDTLTTRSNLAGWRGEAGDAAGAAQAYADLLADRIRVLGEDHPRTLTTRSNLAAWRGEAGDAAGAAQAYADLLADRIRVLGEDHPDTLTTRNNLAAVQGRAGDAAGAAQAYADLLKHTVRVLGEDHPDTLTTRSNLAAWRGEAGDAAGAAQAYADLLADRIRVLGEDHPDTLTTRNNLAYWQKAAAKAPTGLGNDHA